MISVQNISKYFDSKPALKNISFEIAQGEIVGFLGPNGAGKTTLMRILTSYIPATIGTATVAGHKLPAESIFAKKKIGYLPETPALYVDMTVNNFLKFSAELKGVAPWLIRRQIDKALEECFLKEVKNAPIATLSKGFKQRVGIAQAIIADPEVLILDEPTNGLDPLQIIQIRRLIKNLEYKRTVILSTHILSEIEQMAKRVIILRNGEIAADDALGHLLSTSQSTLEETFLKLTAPPTEFA